MRRMLHGDAVSAAVVLRHRPAGLRRWVLERLFAERCRALRHVADCGAPHPRFGDGSLMSVALRRGALTEPGLNDADYCACLAAVYDRLSRDGARGTAGSADHGFHIGVAHLVVVSQHR